MSDRHAPSKRAWGKASPSLTSAAAWGTVGSTSAANAASASEWGRAKDVPVEDDPPVPPKRTAMPAPLFDNFASGSGSRRAPAPVWDDNVSPRAAPQPAPRYEAPRSARDDRRRDDSRDARREYRDDEYDSRINDSRHDSSRSAARQAYGTRRRNSVSSAEEGEARSPGPGSHAQQRRPSPARGGAREWGTAASPPAALLPRRSPPRSARPLSPGPVRAASPPRGRALHASPPPRSGAGFSPPAPLRPAAGLPPKPLIHSPAGSTSSVVHVGQRAAAQAPLPPPPAAAPPAPPARNPSPIPAPPPPAPAPVPRAAPAPVAPALLPPPRLIPLKPILLPDIADVRPGCLNVIEALAHYTPALQEKLEAEKAVQRTANIVKSSGQSKLQIDSHRLAKDRFQRAGEAERQTRTAIQDALAQLIRESADYTKDTAKIVIDAVRTLSVQDPAPVPGAARAGTSSDMDIDPPAPASAALHVPPGMRRARGVESALGTELDESEEEVQDALNKRIKRMADRQTVVLNQMLGDKVADVKSYLAVRIDKLEESMPARISKETEPLIKTALQQRAHKAPYNRIEDDEDEEMAEAEPVQSRPRPTAAAKRSSAPGPSSSATAGFDSQAILELFDGRMKANIAEAERRFEAREETLEKRHEARHKELREENAELKRQIAKLKDSHQRDIDSIRSTPAPAPYNPAHVESQLAALTERMAALEAGEEKTQKMRTEGELVKKDLQLLLSYFAAIPEPGHGMFDVGAGAGML